jgi:hypothetical protein
MISSDYEAKYLGKSQEITLARISDEMTQKSERNSQTRLRSTQK